MYYEEKNDYDGHRDCRDCWITCLLSVCAFLGEYCIGAFLFGVYLGWLAKGWSDKQVI